ncbi:MAG: UDP-N-acetylmuramoyl-L-alanyl-D-glutamate--2,6-diaminopimelate ligase [Desulfovibrionaceae bacterium]|nr:UDP-N-acetylmuramoyl-L-alanyl-D-glutamate--2,6-diaminopimelate ligase [Desulfovibrionaceae bacterium]
MECAFNDLLAKADQIELCTDSRNIKPGALFFAIKGHSDDGTKYVDQAVEAQAKYLVCAQEEAALFKQKYPHLLVCGVQNIRESVWQLASAHYHTPDTKVKILGLTGTNGKTTCTYLLEALLQSLGHRVGVLGTVSYRYPGFATPAPLTTPGALTLHSYIAKMEQSACDYCVMEVSSHALEQERVYGLPFSGCAFTNLTQDHLDYHQTMENYFKVKERLFTEVGLKTKICALNQDDPYGRRLATLGVKSLTFGFKAEYAPDLKAELLQADTQGCHLRMHYQGKTWDLKSPLIGAFNAANLLTVQALALGLGFTPKDLKALEDFKGVKGRLELVEGCGHKVFVDYAHTPDALENVLSAVRKAGFKRIIAVFGCGGNRDRGKRPLMGEVVARLADVAVLTSDNPRFEDPLAILEDVKPGLKGAKQVLVIADRKEATFAALDLLKNKDECVLICGKGHEDYQIIQGQRHHYSDQEVVQEYYQCN